MKSVNLYKIAATIILLSSFSISLFAQNKESEQKLLKRTKYQTETIDFSPGNSLSVIGAPEGSIEIEGWKKNQLEITSEIEVYGYTENDLKLLADVTGFVVDESLTRVSIFSVGTHDKKYLKKSFKRFPKSLRKAQLPFKINYKIKVPHFTDLEVNGGKGDFKLSLVEGMMRINYLESDAKMSLIGGAIQATIGKGDVDVTIATRSWRGQFAEVLVTEGNMNLWLPKNMNANLKLEVLKNGKLNNSYKQLRPMRMTKFTEKEMYAKAGSGGAELSFKVSNGNLKVADFETIAKN